MVATCFIHCTLLFSLSALHDRPCFSCRITLPCFDYLYPTSGCWQYPIPLNLICPAPLSNSICAHTDNPHQAQPPHHKSIARSKNCLLLCCWSPSDPEIKTPMVVDKIYTILIHTELFPCTNLPMMQPSLSQPLKSNLQPPPSFSGSIHITKTAAAPQPLTLLTNE